MAFSNGTDGLSKEINVTPLIDVLLVLLIIFMVIVPMTPHGLNAALPTPKTTGTGMSRPVLVEVEQGQDGILYRVNGLETDMTGLRPLLAELLARRSPRVVLLKGDGALGFAAISGVIDTGYADGAASVELITPRTARP